MRLTSIESSFHPCTFTAIVPGAYPGEAKMCKKWNVLKWRTFELTGWITWKRLKIDGYMLRCVWQALNSVFIHVTFTAIVPGAYPGRPKCALGWLQKMTHVPLAIAILVVVLPIGKNSAWDRSICSVVFRWLFLLSSIGYTLCATQYYRRCGD